MIRGLAPLATVLALTGLIAPPAARAQDPWRAAQKRLAALEDEPIEHVIEVAREMRSIAGPRLLEVPEDVAKRHRKLLAMPSAGVGRILRRPEFKHLVQNAGGGCYFSFRTRSVDWSDDTDMYLIREEFVSTGDVGLFLSLGDVKLEALYPDPAEAPPGLDRVQYAAWKALWEELRTAEGQPDRDAARAIADELELDTSVQIEPGTTYLLRSAEGRNHDILVALKTIQRDEYGYTFLYRILHEWTLDGARAKPRVWDDPEPMLDDVKWLERLPLSQLVRVGTRIRDIAQAKLLTPDPGLIQQHSASLQQHPESGFARILRRNDYEHVIEPRGGGAYYSFVTQSHSYDEEPDLELSRTEFSSGFYGGCVSFLLDLGPRSFDNMLLDAENPPQDLETWQKNVWTFLWADLREQDGSYGRAILRQKGKKLEVDDEADAILGHSYLLRAILPGEHDVLVAFTSVQEDRHGHTIAWRLLERWPAGENR